MKNKKTILLAAVCFVLVGIFVGTGKNNFSSTPVVASTPTPQPAEALFVSREAMPPERMYWQLFKHIGTIKQKQSSLQAQGESSTLTSTYSKELGLNAPQAQTLENQADNCLQQVQVFDQQAEAIIDEARSHYPGGRLDEGAKPPPPPAQLYALQQQKNKVVLAARDSLKH